MSTLTEPYMSVNGETPHMSFPSFLWARTYNNFGLPRQSVPLSYYPLPYRTMSRQQHNATATSMWDSQRATFSAVSDPYHYTPLGWQQTGVTNIMSDNFIRNQEEIKPASEHYASLPTFKHALLASFSFGPTPITEQAVTSARPATTNATTSFKVESSSPLPVPKLLSNNVDVYKYENVAFDDWLRAPNEHDASSLWESTSASSPFVSNPSDGGSFVDYHSKQQSYQSTQSVSFDNNYGRWSSGATLPSNDESDLASPCSSFNESTFSGGSLPSSDYLFGYPTVVPALRMGSFSSSIDTTNTSPGEFKGPFSSQWDGVTPADLTGPAHSAEKQGIDERHQLDKLLVDMRREGHSYKDIKRVGRFREAESTLRGRVRVLTKNKSERVRRPNWKAQDIVILRKAVNHFLHERSTSSHWRRAFRKMPWKKVSHWMKDHGSSYLFAPATCAKKWKEVKP